MNILILENIVHKRYTLEELIETLNILSNEGITVEDSTDEYLANEDYKLNISCKSGYGTIWYAKTRDNKMYITEVSYEEG